MVTTLGLHETGSDETRSPRPPGALGRLAASVVIGIMTQIGAILSHLDYLGVLMAIVFVAVGRLTARGRYGDIDIAAMGLTMLAVEATVIGFHYILLGRF